MKNKSNSKLIYSKDIKKFKKNTTHFIVYISMSLCLRRLSMSICTSNIG